MDLVDEQDVPLVKRRQDRREVPRSLHGRSRRIADVDPEFAGDDRGEGRLAEAGWAVQQDVVRGFSPPLGRRQQHGQVRLDLALADVFAQGPRAQGPFDDEVALGLRVRRQDA